jgi:hypothetical protein
MCIRDRLARSFLALCQAEEMGLAAFAERASTLGFTSQPAFAEVVDRAFGGTVDSAQFALMTGTNRTRAPMLTARMEEERDDDGRPGHWRCELWMPASAEAPPRDEVDAVMNAISPILGPRQWRLDAEPTAVGDFHIAEQRVDGFVEAYLAADGLHRLGRMPDGPSIVLPAVP